MEKSVVAEHVWENHHPIDWEETTLLDHGLFYLDIVTLPFQIEKNDQALL